MCPLFYWLLHSLFWTERLFILCCWLLCFFYWTDHLYFLPCRILLIIYRTFHVCFLLTLYLLSGRSLCLLSLQRRVLCCLVCFLCVHSLCRWHRAQPPLCTVPCLSALPGWDLQRDPYTGVFGLSNWHLLQRLSLRLHGMPGRHVCPGRGVELHRLSQIDLRVYRRPGGVHAMHQYHLPTDAAELRLLQHIRQQLCGVWNHRGLSVQRGLLPRQHVWLVLHWRLLSERDPVSSL